MTMLVHRVRSWLAAALLPLAFAVAALSPASAAAHPKPHHVRHHVTHHRVRRPVHSGIPQHGGGDGDADNFGGPSDGDGNV
jgi:hypothetical protein